MSKHTPGPWFGCVDNGVYAGFPENYDNPVFQTGCGCCTPVTLSEANARLIATAPDLLEALEELMTCKQGELCDHYPAAYKKARAAIIKARGV